MYYIKYNNNETGWKTFSNYDGEKKIFSSAKKARESFIATEFYRFLKTPFRVEKENKIKKCTWK